MNTTAMLSMLLVGLAACSDASPGPLLARHGVDAGTAPVTTVDAAPMAPAVDRADSGPTNSGAGLADASPGAAYRDPRDAGGGCSAPNKVCGGACVAITMEVANCGGCGNVCMGEDPVCIAGACACNGVLFDYCAGTGCMDVSSDLNNCGRCGNVCDPNVFSDCISGACVNNN